MGSGTSRAGLVAGIVITVGIAGVLLWAGSLFVLAVLDGRSPRTLAWVAFGALLFAIGTLVGRGVATLFGADEDRATAVSAVVGLVLVAGGLGIAHYWADTREPALVTALGPACRGQGVAEAAAPGGGSSRLVVADERGREDDWTRRSAAWRAERASEAAYVACVDRQDVSIEVCQYRPVPGGVARAIERFQEVVTVRVVEARTATEVDTVVLTDDPRGCRKVESAGQGDLHGQVAFSALSEALEPYLTR